MKKSDLSILKASHHPLADIAAFALMPACERGSIVVSAPHGGYHYPSDLYPLDKDALRRFRSLEDSGTSILAEALHRPYRPVLSAHLARAIIDLNRPADALDPALYETPCQTLPTNSPYAPYVAAGYGVMPRLSGERELLHYNRLSLTSAYQLIAQYHTPYHDKLAALLGACGADGLLIDIHSMPDRTVGKPLPDFVFGDDFGITLPAHKRTLIEDYMAQTSHSYGWNYPYSGGYITKTYGALQSPYHSLQIEVNRRLYTGANNQISRPALSAIAEMLGGLLAKLEDSKKAVIAAQ